MANADHLDLLVNKGVEAWNEWRGDEKVTLRRNPDGTFDAKDIVKLLYRDNPADPDLSGANLARAELVGANLSWTNLTRVNLRGADLHKAQLRNARLFEADLTGALLDEANLMFADLTTANLSKACLFRASLNNANLSWARLNNACLRETGLRRANLVGADLRGAELIGCAVHGINAWDLKTDATTEQQDLVVTEDKEPSVTIDSVAVAQFVYLLLHNEEIGDIIDTVGRKCVLLLGRFSGGRIVILERLRDELRKRAYVPMVFNFAKPETKDFTETVRLLAGLSKFVIADITNPKSAPLELQATVPDCMIPFVPILEAGEEPFSMIRDLLIKHRDWVFDPIRYPSLEDLVDVLDTEIIHPAEKEFSELLIKKAEGLRIRDIPARDDRLCPPDP